MLTNNQAKDKTVINQVLQTRHSLTTGTLDAVIRQFLKKRKSILTLTKNQPTPFYVFDRAGLVNNINKFTKAFRPVTPSHNIFYAIKSNPHPLVIQTAVSQGLGLDVSSGRELQAALKVRARQILFTGPGKTAAELELAIKNNQKIIINIDSFGELKLLGTLTRQKKRVIRAGVRINTSSHGQWNKFGIPITELNSFWQAATKYTTIKLEGIHFHNSWSENAKPYAETITSIAAELKKNPAVLRQLKFIDIGGGFWPNQVDGYYPWMLATGDIIKTAYSETASTPNFKRPYYISESVSLETYARDIRRAIDTKLVPLGNFEIFTEPGRIISYPAMHIVIRIADVKTPDFGIADAGTNMVGGELYEYNYYPTVNLSHPASKELKFKLFGSLCTPHDIWSYYCYANKMEVGDIIAIPNQGAYAFTSAQEFIKGIPPVIKLA